MRNTVARQEREPAAGVDKEDAQRESPRETKSVRAGQLEWERTPGRTTTRPGVDKEDVRRDSALATKKTRVGQLATEKAPGRANARNRKKGIAEGEEKEKREPTRNLRLQTKTRVHV